VRVKVLPGLFGRGVVCFHLHSFLKGSLYGLSRVFTSCHTYTDLILTTVLFLHTSPADK
jgi:hypothetical protein